MKKTDKKAKGKTAPGNGLGREVWGIVFVFFGTFTLLALLSYNHSDPSLFTQTKRLPINYGGRIGANVAEAFIQFAGIASFIMVGLLFSVAVKLFRGERFAKLAANLFWHLLSVVTCATFISLVIGSVGFGVTRIACGCVLGGWIAGALLHYLNLWGATLFTLSALLISLVFSTPFSAAGFFRLATALAIGGTAWAVQAFSKAARAIVWAAGQRRKTERLTEKLTEKLIDTGAKGKPAPAHEATVIEFPEEASGDEDDAKPAAATRRPVLEIGDESFLEVVPPAHAVAKKAPVAKKSTKSFTGGSGVFALPPLDLLNEGPAKITELDRKKLIENSELLKKTRSARWSTSARSSRPTSSSRARTPSRSRLAKTSRARRS
ncbi:MAG: DNA translocase FtsK 4TM domain-containing protein [Deltaproteobacteria bacterium]|nr:DNA translocase FtsK 4TM domain-containing protein [Deltaproteobacteria bacterium]